MTEGAHTWKTKYYKGLGTSTGKEAKEYFSDMERHRIPFKYAGPEDDDSLFLVSYNTKEPYSYTFYIVQLIFVSVQAYRIANIRETKIILHVYTHFFLSS